MPIKELIKEIKNTINQKSYLVKNLQIVLEIAKKENLRNVIYWVNWELNGYEDIESIPHYRYIKINVYKHPSDFFGERRYEKTDYFTKPLKEVINNSKKEIFTYNSTNIWGTLLTLSINKSEFLEIIDGVKRKIKEYISMVIKDPKSIDAEFSFIKSENFKEYKSKLEKEELDIILGMLSSYLNDEHEEQIFLKNIKTLLRFEYEHNYKFSMILMAAIIEFLLIRYCENHNIEPEPFNNRKGIGFANYIEAAIKNDIFGEKLRWKLVQTHLREFRNYIHIHKEVKSTEIDEQWYETIKPHFEVLYKHFKS